MNQPRFFLFFAWLLLAFLLWEAWMRDNVAPPSSPFEAATVPEPGRGDVAASSDPSVPSIDPGLLPAPVAAPDASVPSLSARAGSESAAATVVLANDVLRLELDPRGGTVVVADLLAYRREAAAGSPPVRLLSSNPGEFFVAQSGLLRTQGPAAPNHSDAFALEQAPGTVTGADGVERREVAFVWHDPDGALSVRRIYALEPGSYVLSVREEIANHGEQAWAGQVYRQMERVPPLVKGGGFTNPEAYSFVGAGWYSPQDKFEKKAFGDFETREMPVREATGGWLAMLQHYFMAAWIPAAEAPVRFSLLRQERFDGSRYLVRQFGPALAVPAGGEAVVEARMWIGPKLQDVLPEVAPGLGLTVNYGIFTILSDPLYWLLSLLHGLFGNWGWAIVGLVVLIKLVFFKLSEAQYKSFAKLRAFQPRIEALKERYGEDKQKFQQAMMELYKKEKINPVGGCLPILVQIPVFIALYWVLLESVELRHAPWIGWIQNLTERDPYFILPVLNALTMWYTQKLSPTPGMDPIQKKMLQFMPLAFGVLFAFFPAGLVLYWTTNGALGLLQQWVIIRRHGDKPGAIKP